MVLNDEWLHNELLTLYYNQKILKWSLWFGLKWSDTMHLHRYTSWSVLDDL